MNDDWRVVFSADTQQALAERALVLTSLNIEHTLLQQPPGIQTADGHRYALVVPASVAERATYELWQYDRENQPTQKRTRAPLLNTNQNPLPGLLAYATTLLLFAWLLGEGAFGIDWLGHGRIDGSALRDGEWWRPFTALTLHLDVQHLLGNLGFGLLFGFLAGRMTGSGVGWLAIVLAAALANALNTLLLDATHRSIGASTAVFAALGLASGFAWRGRLHASQRWPYRWGPVVGGVALLAFTGTGSENTDVGAHLAGFVCGFLAGCGLTYLPSPLTQRTVQWAAGAIAAALIALGWWAALR